MAHEKQRAIKSYDCEISIETYPKTDKEENYNVGTDRYEINGTGRLIIYNTGGSSASEGGMGTGGGEEKGPGISTEEVNKTGSKPGTAVDDGGWDPLKPKEEKEKVKD